MNAISQASPGTSSQIRALLIPEEENMQRKEQTTDVENDSDQWESSSESDEEQVSRSIHTKRIGKLKSTVQEYKARADKSDRDLTHSQLKASAGNAREVEYDVTEKIVCMAII